MSCIVTYLAAGNDNLKYNAMLDIVLAQYDASMTRNRGLGGLFEEDIVVNATHIHSSSAPPEPRNLPRYQYCPRAGNSPDSWPPALHRDVPS